MARITLKQLEEFFKDREYSSEPIRLNQCSVINDRKKFVESHLAVLKANLGKKLVMPFYTRLVIFYNLVNDGK